MSYLSKVKSRKFQLTLGALLSILGTALMGQIEWKEAITAIVTTVLGYIAVQGAVDYQVARINKVVPMGYKPDDDSTGSRTGGN